MRVRLPPRAPNTEKIAIKDGHNKLLCTLQSNMIHTLNWEPIETAPINTECLFLFEENIIHSGIKEIKTYRQYPNTKKQCTGTYTNYKPIGIEATYSSEAYFTNAPIKWAKAI